MLRKEFREELDKTVKMLRQEIKEANEKTIELLRKEFNLIVIGIHMTIQIQLSVVV